MAKVRIELDEWYIWTPVQKWARQSNPERVIEVTEREAKRLYKAKAEMDWMLDLLAEKVAAE